MAKGNQDPDWQAGWDTMNALLWSLAPKQGRQETTILLRALPALLARLHEGCVALGMPVPERDAFFERLAVLHAAVARAGLHDTISTSQDSTSADDQAGMDVDMRMDLTGLQPPLDGGQKGVERAQGSNSVLPDLKLGSRIRLRVGLEDKLLKLNWLSPMGGMFLFTNDDGLDALTLTRARLESKFRQGEATLLG